MINVTILKSLVGGYALCAPITCAFIAVCILRLSLEQCFEK